MKPVHGICGYGLKRRRTRKFNNQSTIRNKYMLYIVTTRSAINQWGTCILGAGSTKSEALLNAYGREKLEKGHYIEKVDPNDEDWSDCSALDQYR